MLNPERTNTMLLRSVLQALALALVTIALNSSPGAAQCCGDCDGNADVSINDLVTAVDRALEGCPLPTKPLIASTGSLLYGLDLRLDTPATKGHVEFTVSGPQHNGVYFLLNEISFNRHSIGLVREDGQLRFFVRDSPWTTQEIKVDTGSWGFGAHRIAASWGDGRMVIVVDGVRSDPLAIADIVLPAQASIRIGRPDLFYPYSQQRAPLFGDIVFTTD